MGLEKFLAQGQIAGEYSNFKVYSFSIISELPEGKVELGIEGVQN